MNDPRRSVAFFFEGSALAARLWVDDTVTVCTLPDGVMMDADVAANLLHAMADGVRRRDFSALHGYDPGTSLPGLAAAVDGSRDAHPRPAGAMPGLAASAGEGPVRATTNALDGGSSHLSDGNHSEESASFSGGHRRRSPAAPQEEVMRDWFTANWRTLAVIVLTAAIGMASAHTLLHKHGPAVVEAVQQIPCTPGEANCPPAR